MAGVFSKQFGFASETTIEQLKNFFQNPEHSQEYLFLAECVENVV